MKVFGLYMNKKILISFFIFIICIIICIYCLLYFFNTGKEKDIANENDIKVGIDDELSDTELVIIDTEKDNEPEERLFHNDIAFIKMYFKEDTFTTKNVTVIVANNSTNSDFTTSPYFRLDKLEDDIWEVVASWGTEEVGIFVPAQSTTEFQINWEKVYKELENGRYRLLKRTDSIENFTIYENLTIEFEI